MNTLMDDIACTPSAYGQDLDLVRPMLQTANGREFKAVPQLKHVMWILEKLLLEYLSYNWDIVEEVLRVNREAELNTSESYASLSRLRLVFSPMLA